MVLPSRLSFSTQLFTIINLPSNFSSSFIDGVVSHRDHSDFLSAWMIFMCIILRQYLHRRWLGIDLTLGTHGKVPKKGSYRLSVDFVSTLVCIGSVDCSSSNLEVAVNGIRILGDQNHRGHYYIWSKPLKTDPIPKIWLGRSFVTISFINHNIRSKALQYIFSLYGYLLTDHRGLWWVDWLTERAVSDVCFGPSGCASG